MTSWEEQYDDAISNIPVEGALLVAQDDQRIKLTVVCEEGKPPFVFTQANVSEIVGETPAWYCQGEHDDKFYGLMCIIMPRARKDIAKKFGFSNPEIFVKSLRVIRQSKSGKSLLCEVHKYE